MLLSYSQACLCVLSSKSFVVMVDHKLKLKLPWKSRYLINLLGVDGGLLRLRVRDDLTVSLRN